MFTFQSLVDYDPSVLAGVETVPEGIDSEILKGEIMLQCGLLQPLYSEPATMKAAISQWFLARQWTFAHLLNIINAEYSPIENVDRHDSWTREIERALDRTDNESGSLQGTTGGTATESKSTETGVTTSGETVGEVAAFNSETWANSTRESSTGSTDGTEEVTRSGQTTGTASETRTRRNVADEDETTGETFTQHMHGNIGVTTNQQMIEQELALLAHFNIYEWIALNLRDSLFLEVY